MEQSRRSRVERASLPMVTALKVSPPWVLFLVVLGLVVAGLLLTGILAAVSLAIVAGLLGWLLYLGWPALHPQARAIRGLTVLVVAGAAIWRLFA